MPFHSNLNLLVRTRDGRNVVLQEPLLFRSESGASYRVPAGTASDGASIPQELWSTGLAPFGEYWLAAVLHDATYRGGLEQETVNGQWLPAMLPKAACDDLFLEAMGCLGVDQHTKEVIYEGVKLFGWRAFAEDRGK